MAGRGSGARPQLGNSLGQQRDGQRGAALGIVADGHKSRLARARDAGDGARQQSARMWVLAADFAEGFVFFLRIRIAVGAEDAVQIPAA